MEAYSCPFKLCNNTERPQCNRPEYNNPFLLAEDVCINALRQKVDELGSSPETPELPHGHGLALQLIELALNTPDPAEADAAFERAAAQLATFDAHPAPEPRLRAARDLSYVPIFRLRRRGLPGAEIAQVAYRVLGKSISDLSNHTVMTDRGEIIEEVLKGLLAENCVAALLARAGHAVFPSSHREGGNANPSLNSDFQIIKNDSKLPVEVKFRRVKGIEYDSRTIVILYSSICRAVVEDFYPPHSPPSVGVVGLEIARTIAASVSGQALPYRQNSILKRATSSVLEILEAKKEQ